MDNKPLNKKVLAIILGSIFIIFLGLIITNEYSLKTGKEIFLETRPVDPRDLLRGDYVVLSYKLESDPKVLEYVKKNKLSPGDKIYIILNKNEQGIGEVLTVVPFQQGAGDLFLKAEINNLNNVDLGIGKYFVPEGRGRELERISGNLQVLISINQFGSAKIKNIYHEGEKIDFKIKKQN